MKLAKKEAEDAAEYLLTLKSKDVAEGAVPEGSANINILIHLQSVNAKRSSRSSSSPAPRWES